MAQIMPFLTADPHPKGTSQQDGNQGQSHPDEPVDRDQEYRVQPTPPPQHEDPIAPAPPPSTPPMSMNPGRESQTDQRIEPVGERHGDQTPPSLPDMTPPLPSTQTASSSPEHTPPSPQRNEMDNGDISERLNGEDVLVVEAHTDTKQRCIDWR